MSNSSGATKFVNGYRWPAHDVACAEVIFDSVADIDRVRRFVRKDHRTVIQAGGNCGVWANAFAECFKSVHTWEPDPLNFYCLAFNTMRSKNVFPYHAALGHEPGKGSIEHIERDNCGAGQVYQSDTPAFDILTLDSYDAKMIGQVDLIYFDVEGYELFALMGAVNTIQMWKPVIAVEDKGLSERYGVAKGDVVRYLQSVHDYEVCDEFKRDVVLRPRPKS